jgi:3-hydroxybutyryl-CoA dehydrogenase
MNNQSKQATALSTSSTVAVIGAGAMGSGIAHVVAKAGHPVFLFDTNDAALEKGIAGIKKDLDFLASKGKMSAEDAQATLGRIKPVKELSALKDSKLVIEAIVENLDVKRKVFGDLEDLLSDDAILTSNTSSISITAIAAKLKRPERMLGVHFFNPAPRMALVEIVSGVASDSQLAQTLFESAKAWGKVPVHAKSTPGFIVNRVARPYYAEGLRVLEEQIADIATIDTLMREACGFPLGPFELMDLIGHDVNFAVTNSVFNAYFGDKRFTPSITQQELVSAGRLGRKSGQGFYDYREGAQKQSAKVAPPAPKPAAIKMIQATNLCKELALRIQAAGIKVLDANSQDQVPCLAITDGRTATVRSKETAIASLALFDLVKDMTTSDRIGLTFSDTTTEADRSTIIGALQATGIQVSVLDDVAGLVGMRTVCMLANEASDVVTQGIASAEDIDSAMKYGTNYPIGPMKWSEIIGIKHVATVLNNLRHHYGEERYRLSPLILRKNAH